MFEDLLTAVNQVLCDDIYSDKRETKLELKIIMRSTQWSGMPAHEACLVYGDVVYARGYMIRFFKPKLPFSEFYNYYLGPSSQLVIDFDDDYCYVLYLDWVVHAIYRAMSTSWKHMDEDILQTIKEQYKLNQKAPPLSEDYAFEEEDS